MTTDKLQYFLIFCCFYSPEVLVDGLEDLPSDGLVVGVEADLDHVVHGLVAPVRVFPRLVEVLQGIVGVSQVPERGAQRISRTGIVWESLIGRERKIALEKKQA